MRTNKAKREPRQHVSHAAHSTIIQITLQDVRYKRTDETKGAEIFFFSFFFLGCFTSVLESSDGRLAFAKGPHGDLDVTTRYNIGSSAMGNSSLGITSRMQEATAWDA